MSRSNFLRRWSYVLFDVLLRGIGLSVCLSVGFYKQLYVKTTDRIFTKILPPEMSLWTKKKWLYFGSHLPLVDPHPRIFRKIFQHCEIKYFSTIWLVSPGKISSSSFVKNYRRCIFLDKKVPFKFGSNPNQIKIRTSLGGGPRSPSALVSKMAILVPRSCNGL